MEKQTEEPKKVTADEVKHLADLTSLGHLMAYLNHDPGIDGLIEIKEPLTLAEGAAIFMNGDINEGEKLISTGQIILSPEIHVTLAVMCIRCEPFYLFSHTGKKYE